jgi:thiol-disulfide isomerase/thioredoxin
MRNNLIRNNLTSCALYGVLFFVVILSGCSSPKFVMQDSETKEAMLIGSATWSDWKKNAAWAMYDDSTYTPNDTAIKRLAALAKSGDVSFMLFAGSWCGDSKHEVPKLSVVFKQVGVAWEKVSLYGVTRQKRENTGTAEQYAVKRVPTLIVLRKGKEVGRIVEIPKETIEKDLVSMLEK